MVVGLVLGNVTATVKHDSMNGQKLMVVQPLMANGRSADGDPIVAIDMTGAGPGERVILTSDGGGVREFLNVKATPIRWAIVGIADEASR
ncbi:MAG: EutN/CcmL family microcompartment protein [Pirellulales bacterium]